MDVYKEPIIVICAKNTSSSKIVKGGEYLATNLLTHKSSRSIYLKNVGSYKASHFILATGESLDTISDFRLDTSNYRVNPEHKDYTNKYVKCRYGSTKNIKEDEIYLVETQYKVERKTRYSVYHTYFFKLKNIKNKLSSMYFDELSEQEQRNLKLKTINGDKIKTADETRKFLLYSEQEKLSILIDLFARSLKDASKTKNNINLKDAIISMMLIKGSKYSVIIEDIEPFLEKSISDMLIKKDC